MLLYPSKLSCFDTIPACDKRTDRQTDRPMTTAYTAPAELHAVESTAYINTYTHIYIAPKIVRTNLRRWHRMTRQ